MFSQPQHIGVGQLSAHSVAGEGTLFWQRGHIEEQVGDLFPPDTVQELLDNVQRTGYWLIH